MNKDKMITEQRIARKIGGITYLVGVHFNEGATETVGEKLKRMLKTFNNRKTIMIITRMNLRMILNLRNKNLSKINYQNKLLFLKSQKPMISKMISKAIKLVMIHRMIHMNLQMIIRIKVHSMTKTSTTIYQKTHNRMISRLKKNSS